ncbi:hypothetical protein C8R46DRAFT_38647 [Mycena filopes]|nr:hypothetical protein C8R46DRAFT_38647 [Mycena filopes]
MSTSVPKIIFFLSDLGHRPARLETQFAIEVARDATVPEFLCKVQEEHQELFHSGQCPGCHGLFLVETAWFMDKQHFDRLGMAATGPLNPLYHNIAEKVELLQLTKRLSDYTSQHHQFLVICGSFDLTIKSRCSTTTSLLKRSSDSSEDGASPTKRLKELMPDRLHLSEPVGATRPLTLALTTPGSSFVHWSQPGVVFIDKTRCLESMVHHLRDGQPCYISSPPGTGKTSILSTLHVFYDCQSSPSAAATLSELYVGQKMQSASGGDLTESRGQRLCLMLDFGGIDNALDVSLRNPMSTRMSETLRAFGKKYNVQLGPDVFPDTMSYILMIHKLLTIVREKKLKLFVGIDHFDALILKSLTIFDPQSTKPLEPSKLTAVKTLFQSILNLFVDEPHVLLVMSNLPFESFEMKLKTKKVFRNLSDMPAIASALGVGEQEFDQLSSVFIPDGLRPGVKEELLALGHRNGVYNFNIALHLIAQAYATDNDHRRLPEYPFLRQIGALPLLADLLINLRRSGAASLQKTKMSTKINLPAILTEKGDFWALLFHLDVLKLRKVAPAHTAAHDGSIDRLEVSNRFVRDELFRSLPPTSGPSKYTELEYQLHGLLNGRPTRLVAGLLTTLCNRPLLELCGLNENGFQLVLDLHISDIKKHCSQLALLTDWTKDPKPPRGAPYLVGRGRNGYADSLTMAFPEVAPRRVALIELKYLSLWNLLRHEYPMTAAGKEQWRKERRWEDKLKKFEQKLDGLGEKEILKLQHTYPYVEGNENPTSTVEAIVNDAVAQLQSYFDAVVQGAAVDKGNTWTQGQRNGIKSNEPRVRVTPGADSVVGVVMVGIGRRCILTRVIEPKVTKNKYETTDWAPPKPNLEL